MKIQGSNQKPIQSEGTRGQGRASARAFSIANGMERKFAIASGPLIKQADVEATFGVCRTNACRIWADARVLTRKAPGGATEAEMAGQNSYLIRRLEKEADEEKDGKRQ